MQIKVNNASADRQVERVREREMCVSESFFNFVIFFYSGNLSTYFKVSCRSLQKYLNMSDCITILTGSRSKHLPKWRASKSILFSEARMKV